MRSLKEIRIRLSSITSTRKITSAMKMVSSVKLRKAQDAVLRFVPYQEKLKTILGNLLSAELEMEIPLATKRTAQNVSIVVFSSNTGLCGAFNANVYKKFLSVLENYKHLPAENIRIYTVGKRVSDLLRRQKMTFTNLRELSENPTFANTGALANQLMDDFLTGKTDEVVLIYNFFKNAAVQKPQSEVLLPITIETGEGEGKGGGGGTNRDYILEPTREELISDFLPRAVRLHLYNVMLNTLAAEQGARTTAMQTATDNADNLLQELNIEYNKARQEAITKQILDIVGGAEALKG